MTTAKLELPARKKMQRSKLDPYREQLLEMDQKNIGLAKMREWLKGQGVTAEKGTISSFLSKQRQRSREEFWLGHIYHGAQQCKEVEAAFANNPAPAMDTLIKMHRVLIMDLMTKKKKKEQERTGMDRIKLSNQLTKTVLNCMAVKTRTELKEREMNLAEAKAAESRIVEQEKALQWCLDEVRTFPEVAALFKAAFDALKEKIGGDQNGGGV